MADIPNKADGQVLSASEITKVAGYDNTGGSIIGSVAETTIATVTVGANQLSTAAVCSAVLTMQNSGGALQQSATFKLKRGATVLQTVVLQANSAGAAILVIGGSLGYVDVGATFSNSNTYTVTVTNNHVSVVSTCFNLTVLGV